MERLLVMKFLYVGRLLPSLHEPHIRLDATETRVSVGNSVACGEPCATETRVSVGTTSPMGNLEPQKPEFLLEPRRLWGTLCHGNPSFCWNPVAYGEPCATETLVSVGNPSPVGNLAPPKPEFLLEPRRLWGTLCHGNPIFYWNPVAYGEPGATETRVSVGTRLVGVWT
jgi:uncharacterized protein (DUF433 family)